MSNSTNPRATTLVVILGASEFPYCSFASSAAFKKAAEEVARYFVDPSGFGLDTNNFKYLFNYKGSSASILEQIVEFVKSRSETLKTEGVKIKDLIIYYVGHGAYESNQYYVAIYDTRALNKGTSSIQIASLASAISTVARWIRTIFIFDSCFAAGALPLLQSGPEEILNLSLSDERIPTKGNAFLASSAKDAVSMTTAKGDITMFSKALLSVLKSGSLSIDSEWLSLEAVYVLVNQKNKELYKEAAITPELHSPKQSEGNVAKVAIFPNPAFVQKKLTQLKKNEEKNREIAKRFLAAQQLKNDNDAKAAELAKLEADQEAVSAEERIIQEAQLRASRLAKAAEDEANPYRQEAEQVWKRTLDWDLLDLWLDGKKEEALGALLTEKEKMDSLNSDLNLLKFQIAATNEEINVNSKAGRSTSTATRFLIDYYAQQKQKEKSKRSLRYVIAKLQVSYDSYESVLSGKLKETIDNEIRECLRKRKPEAFSALVEKHIKNAYSSSETSLFWEDTVADIKSFAITALIVLFFSICVYACVYSYTNRAKRGTSSINVSIHTGLARY